MADSSGIVTIAHDYTPFGVPLWSEGSATTGYGFTGERWEAYSQLLFLRARYYEPGTGRFLSGDLWEGDYYRPQTLLQNFLYVLNNPVNAIDPTGLYHKEVHKDLTKRLVLEIASGCGILAVCEQDISEIISEKDLEVDSNPDLSSARCRRCHFCDWAATAQHVEKAIASGNPYLSGTALHQVQDYFSHWGEGYGEEGHAGHTALRTAGGRTQDKLDDFFEGGHWVKGYGFQTRAPSRYEAHSEGAVRTFLQSTNPQANVSSLSKKDLIDLYLRKDQGRDLTMRDYFGFDPDMYISGSSRDNLMEWFTRYYIRKFMDTIVTNSCAIDCTDLNIATKISLLEE